MTCLIYPLTPNQCVFDSKLRQLWCCGIAKRLDAEDKPKEECQYFKKENQNDIQLHRLHH